MSNAKANAAPMNGDETMSEATENKKSRTITFRLSSEQYDQVEQAALASGEDANSWCRKLALLQLTEGFGLTKNDRLMYEEIARVRYLVGHGFRLFFESKGSPELWKKLTKDIDQHSEIIANDLISRRHP
jgi:hypothetical protein